MRALDFTRLVTLAPAMARGQRGPAMKAPAGPRRRCVRLVTLGLLVLALPALARAQGPSNEELAKKLSNPVASLISVPLQNNSDFGIGPVDDGFRNTLNIQPVIPISLTTDWNLISRTILPVVYQDEIFPGSADQFGFGDTLQSFFLSPKAPGAGGLIWGVGPVLLLPTATDDLLGGGKWGAGPTVVALKQDGPLTVGILANHVWSFAGDADRADVNQTFLQPFLSYTLPSATTFTVNTEATYDWNAKQWTVPLLFGVSQVLRIGPQLISVGLNGRYWVEGPDSAPDYGIRFILTFLFPK